MEFFYSYLFGCAGILAVVAIMVYNDYKQRKSTHTSHE